MDGELMPSCLTPVKFDASKLLNSGNGIWKYVMAGAGSFWACGLLVYSFYNKEQIFSNQSTI